MHIEEARNRVIDVWRDSAEATLCLALVNYLVHQNRALERVSFGLINQVARENHIEDEHVVAEAVQFLIGHDLHLLDPIYEYIDDDDDVFVVSNSDIKHTFATGEFFHPETGEADPEYESKVFLSFVPSRLAKDLGEAE